MQIATKAMATPNHHVVILDAPGHSEFIPMMIQGTANADVALLVVDASESFEAAFHHGQTKEHILLARGLGVSQVLVCVNKLDVMDWSREVYEGIRQQLWPFLTQQANFAPKRIRFVPTSGLTGINILKTKGQQYEPPNALLQWYKEGPTLSQAIDSFQPVKHTSLGKFRIATVCWLGCSLFFFFFL